MGQFNWTVNSGSVNTAVFTFQNPDGTPYSISGLTWEYVVRRDASDAYTAAVATVTATPSSAGVLVANTGASTVTVTLYPATTLALPARAVYAHTLWSDPGDATQATAWVSGSLINNQVAQP
jgi:hypothetical protein